MYLGTHICLPIVAVALTDIVSPGRPFSQPFNTKQLLMIGLAGILPDLLWPHFSMQGRLNSWTHTVWFLAILLPIVYLLSKRFVKQNYLMFLLIIWLAAIAHVLMDSLSGGVKLFYPIDKIVGGYYISHSTWGLYDIIFISLTAILLYIRYVMKRKAVVTPSNHF